MHVLHHPHVIYTSTYTFSCAFQRIKVFFGCNLRQYTVHPINPYLGVEYTIYTYLTAFGLNIRSANFAATTAKMQQYYFSDRDHSNQILLKYFAILSVNLLSREHYICFFYGLVGRCVQRHFQHKWATSYHVLFIVFFFLT